MRALLAASLLTLFSGVAYAQAPRGSVYLSVMGEPFIAPSGQSPLALWLAKADTDRSGAVSLAEITADAERFFKSLDVDADGRIGGIEMTRYEEQIAPAGLRAKAGGAGPERDWRKSVKVGARGDSRSIRSGDIGPDRSLSADAGNVIGGPAGVPQPVAMADVDMSGFVTPDEFARAAARRFATLDVNKNGLLEQAELTSRAR